MDGHIDAMLKISNRDRILSEGLKVVHAQGFARASVRDIVKAAGVPQGSFTNHFASKEAFGLEVIDIYCRGSREIIETTLRNEGLPPLKRIAAYIEENTRRLNESGMRYGCMFGNFAAEASDHNEPIRQRLLQAFEEMRSALAACLSAAVKDGDVDPSLDTNETAAFIVSSMQGATLLSKAQQSPAAMKRFKQVVLTTVVRPIKRP